MQPVARRWRRQLRRRRLPLQRHCWLLMLRPPAQREAALLTTAQEGAPAEIGGHPWTCAPVGSGNDAANQARTAGENDSSTW